MARGLTDLEKRIILRLLRIGELIGFCTSDDLETVAVEQIDEYGSIKFTTVFCNNRYSRLDGAVITGIQQGINIRLSGGPAIELILFFSAGCLRELQIFVQDGSALRVAIEPDFIEKI